MEFHRNSLACPAVEDQPNRKSIFWMADHPCRCCGRALHEIFVDLGKAPLANSFVSPENARAVETSSPLRALVMSAIRDSGGKFVVPIPNLQIMS